MEVSNPAAGEGHLTRQQWRRVSNPAAGKGMEVSNPAAGEGASNPAALEREGGI